MKILVLTTLLLAYLSAVKASSSCPEGWVFFDGFCYYARDTVKTFQEAQDYCSEMNADLAKITSQQENDFVLALARRDAPAAEQVWIGLFWHKTGGDFWWSDKTGGDFWWSDLSVPVYKNWAPGEPNGNADEPCGMMFTRKKTDQRRHTASGYWNDLKCSRDQAYQNWECGFVCKKLA
ncbi:perlucin-like protein [Montipora foliosa]|uniref:perlucin-like protein n=1 Tax=Montipora foliosa TaxID=591990 RepID=UPI0035F1F882